MTTAHAERLAASRIPARYFLLRNSAVWDEARLPRLLLEWVRGKNPPKGGIVILGDAGVGKTAAGNYMLESWITSGRGPGRYLSIPDIAPTRDRNDWSSAMRKDQFVHVDDLGYQKYDEPTATWLFSFLDSVYRRCVPVVFTTSQTEAGIRGSLGNGELALAAWDRLRSYNTVKMEGKSLR